MLKLAKKDSDILKGKNGLPAKKALEIIVALAEAADADKLVDVGSAQISGVSFRNIGEAGLSFLEEWAENGAQVRVPSYMNPCGMDTRAWRELGVPAEFAERQERIIRALLRMGVTPELTCAPYHVGYVPRYGEHIAWSESSAVSMANSIFGARTNREGGPSALASAIAGRTALFGYHLDENRKATHLVRVRCPVNSFSDFGALGFQVGKLVGNGVPYFTGIEAVRDRGTESIVLLKALGAAMAASGAVALFHVEAVTPEASIARPKKVEEIAIESLEEGYFALGGGAGPIDLAWIGCPHASVSELQHVAALLGGVRLKSRLWVTAARKVIEDPASSEAVRHIVAVGGRVVADTCMVVAPLREMGIEHVATNSGKGAYYLPTHCGVTVHFGETAECIEAAVTGFWKGRPQPSLSAPVGKLSGRAIFRGEAEGEALCTSQRLGFFGHVDPRTGIVNDPGHELHGKSLAGKVLVFPGGKGSTVGSYVLYAMRKNGVAPAAIVIREAEPIIAVGAVIAQIPAVSGVDVSRIRSGSRVRVRGAEVEIG